MHILELHTYTYTYPCTYIHICASVHVYIFLSYNFIQNKYFPQVIVNSWQMCFLSRFYVFRAWPANFLNHAGLLCFLHPLNCHYFMLGFYLFPCCFPKATDTESVWHSYCWAQRIVKECITCVYLVYPSHVSWHTDTEPMIYLSMSPAASI